MVLPVRLVFQGRLLAFLAGVQPFVPQTDLLAVGILVDQQLRDPPAGNLQGPEVAQGRVYPCLPLAGLPLVVLPSVDLPLVGQPSGGTCAGTCVVTVGLEASVDGPLLEEEMFGKAAGLQSLLEEEGSAWDQEHSCPSS